MQWLFLIFFTLICHYLFRCNLKFHCKLWFHSVIFHQHTLLMLAHNSHSLIKELLLYVKRRLQSKYTVSPPILGFCIRRFDQPRMESILEKIIPGSSKKQNLNLPCTSNYLHRIYFVFTTIYVAFTLH